MKYAIISDIHANEDALSAVLTDARDERVDKIICLGDVLGYGPDAAAALELIYREAHICLAGNHDDAAAGRFPIEDFTEFAESVIKRHRTMLKPKALEWLGRLPYTCELDGFACAHANFVKPEGFDYILEEGDAKLSFDARKEQLLFVGHSHEPCMFVLGASGVPHKLEAGDFVLEEGKRYIVNPGSVGYPRSGNCRSSYCIYDTEAKSVYFRSLPFEIDRYRKKMNGKGMDEAPWIAAKAKERSHAGVRNDEKFGKPEKKKKITRTINLTSDVKVPMPVREKKKDLKVLLIPAIVIAALIVALAGLFCTIKLTSQKVPEAVKVVEIKSTPQPLPAKEDNDSKFSGLITLPGGWQAAVENPSNQSVKQDTNKNPKKKSVLPVFRISNKEDLQGKIFKTFELLEKPQKMKIGVKLLTYLPGKEIPFKIRSRLTFITENGAELEPFYKDAKRSITEEYDVPEEAVSVKWEIFYRCKGTFDLTIPHYEFKAVKKK